MTVFLLKELETQDCKASLFLFIDMLGSEYKQSYLLDNMCPKTI